MNMNERKGEGIRRQQVPCRLWGGDSEQAGWPLLRGTVTTAGSEDWTLLQEVNTNFISTYNSCEIHASLKIKQLSTLMDAKKEQPKIIDFW